MDYCIFLNKVPTNESPFWHSILQILGAEKAEGARVQPMAMNPLVIALSAVSTYKAR